MDLLLLPQTVQKTKKIVSRTTSRATFRSFHVPQTGSFQFSGFCYIGRNSSNIMKLVELYKEGSVLEGLEKAKTELIKSIEQGKNKLPEVIICEARFDFATISHFNQFLRKHSVLSSIPMILDVSGLGSKDVALYRKHARPDEKLFIEECDKKDMASKKKYLCRMKAHSEK
jgi:hypothetical protein